MTASRGSLGGLRRSNRQQVLEVLRHRGTASRAEIAKQTGLSTTTISTLVGELLDEAVLVERSERSSSAGGGRPARMLVFNPGGGGAVGIHLAHDHVRVGVTDLAGSLVAQTQTGIDVDHAPQDTLDFAAAAALELMKQAGLRTDSVVGLGVAVSAPVSAATHTVGAGPILGDWRGVDVAEELARRTGLRVSLGNDANLGAIAEHRFGVAQNVDDLLYVMLSDGVGAGLVLGGRLYEGAAGGAGELGHVTVVPDGYVCRCGNRGCLETLAGADAITRALALTRGTGTTVADVVAAADAGDHGARRVLADVGRAVGRAIVPVCTVLDPALVVLGGDCAASEPLLTALRTQLAQGITPMRRDTIPVVGGALGDEAEMLGAVALATQSMVLH